MVDSVFVMPGTVAAPRTGILRDLHSRYETVREALTRIDKAARELGLPDISTRLIEDVAGERPYSPEVQYLEIFAVEPLHVPPARRRGRRTGGDRGTEHRGTLGPGRRRARVGGRRRAPGGGPVPGTDPAGVAGHDARRRGGRPPRGVTRRADRPPAPGAGLREHAPAECPQWSATADRRGGAGGRGARSPSVRLDVPHPTHTPAVAQAARDLLATAPPGVYGGGRWRVSSPWLGRDIGDEDPVELVAGALTAQVRMLHTVRALHAAGADTFIECGEWPVVTRFVEASVPGIQSVVPLSEHDPVAAVRALVAGRTETMSPQVRTPASPPVPATPPPVAAAPPVPARPAPTLVLPPPVATTPAPAVPAVPTVPAAAVPAAPSSPAVRPPPAPRRLSRPSWRRRPRRHR